MKVIIVDDNIEFRNDLIFFLEEKLHHTVIGVAQSGEEFLQMVNIHLADIVLMDIAMGKLDGFDTTKLAIWRFPYLNVIAVTMFAERLFLVKLLETGFKGCVLKNDVFQLLEDAMNNVQKGELSFPENVLIQ